MTTETTADAFDVEMNIIDVDTHVIEPYDLWTSRVSVERWGKLVPHVRPNPVTGSDTWYFGDDPVRATASAAHGFYPKFPPDWPPTLADAHPTTWNVDERLKLMDEYGTYAQVLYPNVAGFGAGNYAKLDQPELRLALLKAYNDFLVDYSSVAPKRFVPIMAVPFWDMDMALAEIDRAYGLGHRGIIFTQKPDSFGHPPLRSQHWDPIWRACEERQLPVNFHIGSGDSTSGLARLDKNAPDPAGHRDPANKHANMAANSIGSFVDNANTIAALICGGVTHRFPDLNFVSVESGIGWMPFAIEAIEWMWDNCGVNQEHPEFDLRPSEYFSRQIYGCFWFEEKDIAGTIERLGPGNVLYETDFPHTTSMTPGEGSAAVSPPEYRERALKALPADIRRKVLFENAAELYKVDPPQ